uniref:Uncharacterized protein n=1 Tax=Quercus lobata TaxID=97700 RepID=A0A7N2KU58_QUELO
MLQFSKRLVSKGLKATVATTVFIHNTMKPQSSVSLQFDTISDGYDEVHRGLLKLPITSISISIPGLPVLELEDMPSFIRMSNSYPSYLELLEVDSMSKFCRLLPIGPTIPSFYLDNRVENDKDYGLNLFVLDSYCTNWLNTKPEGSVIYVSFGSMANLNNKQMEELTFALKGSNFYFLWVVEGSEEAKLPEKFVEDVGNKGGIELGSAFSGDATMDRSNSKFQVCSGCVEDGSEV